MVKISDSIHFTADPSAFLQQLLNKQDYSSLVVIDDENTRSKCYPLIQNVVKDTLHITIPAGEEYKNLTTCQKVWSALTNANIDRKALIINLGGGVVGDLGGFCAATYKRGIRFINIPTTVLSQVDASIGGKLGIDFQDFKNQIGVFQNPLAVIINPEFLKTLPEDEKISGFAEVVKHALISDRQLWNDLMKTDIKHPLDDIISRAVNIKVKIVEDDPLENAGRKLLNFGHTLGHALESYLLSQKYRKILHGEAIAAGMIMETWLSVKMGFLSEEESQQIQQYLLSVFPLVKYHRDEIDQIASLLVQDKKNVKGSIRCSLLEGIGKGIYDIAVSQKESEEALQKYLNNQKINF